MSANGEEFPMQDGPWITMERAKEIYAEYSCMFGTHQSLQRLGERGGFGYSEVDYIAKKHAEMVKKRQCTCPKKQ